MKKSEFWHPSDPNVWALFQSPPDKPREAASPPTETMSDVVTVYSEIDRGSKNGAVGGSQWVETPQSALQLTWFPLSSKSRVTRGDVRRQESNVLPASVAACRPFAPYTLVLFHWQQHDPDLDCDKIWYNYPPF